MAKKLQIFGKFPSGGPVDPSEVERVVGEYLEENPPTPKFTINGEGSDENGNYTINTIVDITLTSDDEPDEPGNDPSEPGLFDVVNTSDDSSPLAVLF